MLTGEGEQLLRDCRGLLNYASAIDERAQQLRRGGANVLKVASSPQFIEGVISDFLHRYAQRHPNVEVKLVEAFGADTLTMLERGEIHLGQTLADAAQSSDRHFASRSLQLVDLLAVSHPRLKVGNGSAIEIGRLAQFPLLLLDTGFIFRLSLLKSLSGSGISLPKKRHQLNSRLLEESFVCCLYLRPARFWATAATIVDATTFSDELSAHLSPATIHAARRSRWCRPPTCGKAITVPVVGGCTGRGSGQSLSSERCVRLRW